MPTVIPRVNDTGTIFRATIKDESSAVVNVSGASTKQIRFEKANGTLMTGTATFTTNGTDGKVQYVAVSGDLSVAGDWKAQAFVVLAGGGGQFSSSIHNFRVGEALS